MVDIQISMDVPEELFDIGQFQSDIQAVLEDEVKIINKLFAKVYATWSGRSTPKPKRIIRVKDKEAYGEVSFPPEDSHGNKIMSWLNFGTTTRHAVMQQPWMPKTQVKKLASGAGQRSGRKPFVSKSIYMPGIDKRLWDTVIEEQRRKPFQRKVEAAVAKL